MKLLGTDALTYEQYRTRLEKALTQAQGQVAQLEFQHGVSSPQVRSARGLVDQFKEGLQLSLNQFRDLQEKERSFLALMQITTTAVPSTDRPPEWFRPFAERSSIPNLPAEALVNGLTVKVESLQGTGVMVPKGMEFSLRLDFKIDDSKDDHRGPLERRVDLGVVRVYREGHEGEGRISQARPLDIFPPGTLEPRFNRADIFFDLNPEDVVPGRDRVFVEIDLSIDGTAVSLRSALAGWTPHDFGGAQNG